MLRTQNQLGFLTPIVQGDNSKNYYGEWYVGECMISTININKGVKEPIQGYQNCDISITLVSMFSPSPSMVCPPPHQVL